MSMPPDSIPFGIMMPDGFYRYSHETLLNNFRGTKVSDKFVASRCGDRTEALFFHNSIYPVRATFFYKDYRAALTSPIRFIAQFLAVDELDGFRISADPDAAVLVLNALIFPDRVVWNVDESDWDYKKE